MIRAAAGLRPTQGNENHKPRQPRESWGLLLVPDTMGSRFRGDDMIFEKTLRGEETRPSAGETSP